MHREMAQKLPEKKKKIETKNLEKEQIKTHNIEKQ